MDHFASVRAAARRVALLACLLLTWPLASFAAGQRSFPTPEAAVVALVAALESNDEPALVAIFGEEHKNVVVTGDAANDAAKRAEAAALFKRYHALDDSVPDRRVLLIGERAWPLPIPLIRRSSGWRFATEEGVQEILNRRIGGNERSAVVVLRAYVEAQREYASRDRDGDGVLQYAGKLSSTPGKFDGLYWPADTGRGEEASPLGPLIAQSAAYLSGHKKGDAYRGYHFRILSRQGPGAAGGAYNYVINGRLIAGFALVAYPDAYGDSGVMTFVVNQNGKVFEKDLGKSTGAIAERMARFDPGAGWRETPP